MTIQSGLPPYTMTCMSCGAQWDPKRTTDHGLEREAREHECAAVPADHERVDAAGVVDGPLTILTDLITELRDRADECGAADGWRLPGAVMRVYADRAEARLREVQGE